MPDIVFFQEIEDSLFGSSLQEMNQIIFSPNQIIILSEYVSPNQRMIRITAELIPFGMASFVELKNQLMPLGMGSFSELVPVGTDSG